MKSMLFITMLQSYAKDQGINGFVEAIESIKDYLNEQVDAENDTRLSFGTHNVSLVPYSTMDNVEYWLTHYYTPKDMEEAINCVMTLTSMDNKSAKEHIILLMSKGRNLESIIDEAYKIMAL